MTGESEQVRDLSSLLRPLSSRLRPVFAWLTLSFAVAPYFTLLAVRHTGLTSPDSFMFVWTIELSWAVFPIFFVTALMLVKGRMRAAVLLVAVLFLPFVYEWTRPTRGRLVAAPWYCTKDKVLKSESS